MPGIRRRTQPLEQQLKRGCSEEGWVRIEQETTSWEAILGNKTTAHRDAMQKSHYTSPYAMQKNTKKSIEDGD